MSAKFDREEVCVEIRSMFIWRRNVAEKSNVLMSRAAGDTPKVKWIKENGTISIGDRVFIQCRPRRKKERFTVGFRDANNTRYFTHYAYDDIDEAKTAAVAIFETLNSLGC
jgi:hypothetical protein